jgi:flagellar hook-associated protein 3 FlgL
MSIGRITTSQMLATSAANIQISKARISQLSAEASSGIAVSKPSDDPAAAASIMQVLAQQGANTQYASNIDDGLGWLSTADSSLTSAENLVQQASDLTVQAANSGTSSATSRAAIASQLSSIRDQLLSTANATYLGRSVFAGTSDASSAFDPTSYGYNGTSVGTVQRRVGSGATDTVTVSADGAAAFGSGTASVFQKIQNVIDALNSSTYSTDTSSTGPQATITQGITDLKSALSSLTAVHASVGTNYSRLETAKTQNSTTSTALESQRSGLQDADFAKTVLDLKTQELTYQTALQVTAQVIQPTLMSYLTP